MKMSLSFAGLRSRPAAAGTVTVPSGASFAVIAGTVVFAAVLWMPVVLIDPDTLWHIITGEWILANHQLPLVDTYPFPQAGQPWVAHEWLSEIILALVYRWSGWNGVLILTAASAGWVIGLVAAYVRPHVRTDIAVMLVVLATACTEQSLLSRPHILALPVLALWTVGLVSARERATAPPILLLPLMTLWANLHGGFMIGLALAVVLGLEALFDSAGGRHAALRGWGVFGLAAVLAAMITPRGVDTLLFPFQLLSLHNLVRIREWYPSDFSQLNGVSASILLALYLGIIGKLRLPRFRVLLSVGLVFVTMQHVRYAQAFGVIVPVLLAGSLGHDDDTRTPPRLLLPKWTPIALAGALATISLLVRIALPVEREDAGYYAKAALDRCPPGCGASRS
jgi:hypothetical protein